MKRSVNELTAPQLTQLLKIRRRMDALDRVKKTLAAQAEKIIKGGRLATGSRRRRGTLRPSKRRKAGRRKVLREAMTEALRRAGKPLTVPDLYQALLKQRYPLKSKEPKKVIAIRLYTDRKTFRKVKPGCFTLRKK